MFLVSRTTFIHTNTINRFVFSGEEDRQAQALRPDEIDSLRDPEPLDPGSPSQNDVELPLFEPHPPESPVSQTPSDQIPSPFAPQPPGMLSPSGDDDIGAPQQSSSETANTQTSPSTTPASSLIPTSSASNSNREDHPFEPESDSSHADRNATNDRVMDVDMTGWPSSLIKVYRYLVRSDSWGSEWQATIQSFAQWEFSSTAPVSLNTTRYPSPSSRVATG